MHSDGWQAHWFQHCLIFHTDSGALLLGTERRLCSPTCRLKPTCLTPVLPSRQQTCCLAFCSLNYGWMLKIHFGTRWGLGPWKNPKASPQGSQCCRAAGGRGHEQQQWLQSSWGLSALQGSQRPGSSLLLETNTNIHSSTLLFENRVSIQAETKQTEPTLLWLDLVILVVCSNLNNSVALKMWHFAAVWCPSQQLPLGMETALLSAVKTRGEVGRSWEVSHCGRRKKMRQHGQPSKHNVRLQLD